MRRLLAPCLLVLLATGCAFSGKRAPAAPVLPEAEFRAGDLAFRTGTGLYSSLLNLQAEQIQYSHVGVLVRENGQWLVVHAVPGEVEGPDDFERVKAETPALFFAPDRARHGALVHTGLPDARRLGERALRMVRDSVRFDGNFDLDDTTEVYCTELVYRLFLAEGIDLSEGRRSYANLPLLSGKGTLSPEDLLRYSGNERYFVY